MGVLEIDGHFGAVFARPFGVTHKRDEAETRNVIPDFSDRSASMLFHR